MKNKRIKIKKPGIIILAMIFSLLLINLVNAGVSDEGVEYDSELIAQFLLSDWVHVTVDVKDFSNIVIFKDDSVEIQAVKDNERWNIFRNTSYSILETLSENEFQLKRKSGWGRSFSGDITKEGFEKLLRNIRVKKIYAKKEIHISSAKAVKSFFMYLIIPILLLVVLIIMLIKLVKLKRKIKWKKKR